MHSGIAFVKLRVAEIQHLGTITVELHTDCESHTSYPDKILESQSNGSTNPWLTELMLYPSHMVQFGGPYPPNPKLDVSAVITCPKMLKNSATTPAINKKNGVHIRVAKPL